MSKSAPIMVHGAVSPRIALWSSMGIYSSPKTVLKRLTLPPLLLALPDRLSHTLRLLRLCHHRLERALKPPRMKANAVRATNCFITRAWNGLPKAIEA